MWNLVLPNIWVFMQSVLVTRKTGKDRSVPTQALSHIMVGPFLVKQLRGCYKQAYYHHLGFAWAPEGKGGLTHQL